MEIGLSTASYFNKLQIEDAALDIARHQVPLCEVFLNTYSEYEPAFVSLLAERLRAGNVAVFSIHPMSMQFEPQLFSVHPRQRADAWRVYEQVLADGQTLGARHYVMHGPARLFGGVKNIQLARVAPIFVELIQLARSYGIQLTLENVSWCVFNEPEYGLRLLEAIGSEDVKFTLDVKQAVRSGFDPLDFIRAVGSQIVNVHLCDATKLESGAVRYDMPGFGAYDFDRMFTALANVGYRGPAFIEVYSDMYDEIPTLYESRARMIRVAERVDSR
ncbi:MAG: sugar phosphate isomerase/epimerase [Clostridiaceae bacterium]